MISRDCRFFLAVLLTAVPLPSVAADLKIMAEDAAEPFSRADGMGYANDVVKAAFHAAGVEIQLDADVFLNRKSPSQFARIEDIATGATVGIINQYEYPDAIYGLRRQGAV